MGVVGGFNDIFIIDCDKLELAQACEGLLPKTYSEQTCSGGYHYFYRIKGKFDNKDINGKAGHYGEIRSFRKYVVMLDVEGEFGLLPYHPLKFDERGKRIKKQKI